MLKSLALMWLFCALLCGCGASRQLNAAHLLMQAGKPAEALQVFQDITRSFPDNTNALTGQAAAYIELGQPSRAEQYILRALEIE